MKKLYHIILLIVFCIVLNPAFAKDYEISNHSDSGIDDQDSDQADEQDKEVFLKDRKKDKKKKGERNTKIQPSDEDDANIILELDKT